MDFSQHRAENFFRAAGFFVSLDEAALSCERSSFTLSSIPNPLKEKASETGPCSQSPKRKGFGKGPLLVVVRGVPDEVLEADSVARVVSAWETPPTPVANG